ncbi:hypothetical protein POM88_041259 [Heracleum sosnowskyi]|uniref:Beta-galactosidase beta-sandwich domain-containing protein n=1 Tax=Heracleum sosnowskyi TaxID=360622 RepID=A0AAD8HGA9_9APIA|nr:hypothetical protein POM88_041259 [Heracleum sosnowskyi]
MSIGQSLGLVPHFLPTMILDPGQRLPILISNMTCPPWSISILPDCKNEVFNTAKVGFHGAHMKMLPAPELFILLHPLAISKAGLQASEDDYYQINEAFSVLAPSNKKLFGISDVSSL